MAFPVREPRTSLVFRVPARVDAGAAVPVTLTTFAEVSRVVSVELNVTGVPCAPNLAANDGATVRYGDSILGGPTPTTINLSTPSTNGQYRLCGYVGRYGDDPAPHQVVDSGPFTVGPVPRTPSTTKRCTVSPSRLSRRGTITVSCNGNVRGEVSIVASRGRRVRTVTRTLVRGKAKASAKKLGLAKGRTKITVRSAGKAVGATTITRR